MEKVLELITHHKKQLSRLDDGQIWWDDTYVKPFTNLYENDSDAYIKELDTIMCDVQQDRLARLSAYNLYDLIWFSKKEKSTDIVLRIRRSFQKIINEDDNDVRRELLCFMHKFCSGSTDDLLISAYEKACKDNDSSFQTISFMLRRFELIEQISESRNIMYVNFRHGIEQVVPFEERMENFKQRFPNEGIEKRKKYVLSQLNNVVENGDIGIAVKMVECMFGSKYAFKPNKRVMASYLRQVPEIWNKVSKKVKMYG